MQPGAIALFEWIGLRGSPVPLDIIPVASDFTVIFQEDDFSLVGGCDLAPESAERSVRNEEVDRVAPDVSDEHIRRDEDGTRWHRDPAFGSDFELLLAKSACRRSQAIEGQMGSLAK